MANEQQGVSSASAGEAPASGRWRTGNRNPRNLYWTRPDAADEHRGVMFDPADGPFAVEALNARLLVVEAEYSAKTGPSTGSRSSASRASTPTGTRTPTRC